MLLGTYNLLWRVARPWLLRKLQRRGRHEPQYLHAIHQRCANYTAQEWAQAQQHAGQWLWIHAVSLGETRAAAVLLQALRAAQPDLHLLLTHTTATGWQEGTQLLREGDMQVWLPWDERGAVQRFVRTFRPRAGLLMETEIWPQLLRVCQQHNVPVALANARVSAKTLRQWQRLPRFARQTWARLAVAYAQTAQDAANLQTLGAAPVIVTGNLKFDATPDASLLQQGRTLRQQWQAGSAPRPVIMLASSREGEEAMWLQALQSLPAQQRKAVQWLVVPRHPQRFDEVAALLADAGYQVQRRSAMQAQAGGGLAPAKAQGEKEQAGVMPAASTPSPQPSPPEAKEPYGGGEACANAPATLWLGDTLGEMPLYYAMANVVLMGGSFAPLGGQNLIEACACGCPVLLGPHTFNFAQASGQAIAAGAALRCADMDHAVQQALALVQPDKAGAAPPATTLGNMQQAALQFSQAHRGAAGRTAHDMQQRGWLGECGHPRM